MSTISTLVNGHRQLLLKKQALETEVKGLSDRIKELEEVIIPQAMEDEGFTSFTAEIDGVEYKVRLENFYFPKFNTDNEAEVEAYLKEHGEEALIKKELTLVAPRGQDYLLEQIRESLSPEAQEALTLKERAGIHNVTLRSYVKSLLEQEGLSEEERNSIIKTFAVYTGVKANIK